MDIDILQEKINIQTDKQAIDRDVEVRICASLYVRIENKMDNIFLIGAKLVPKHQSKKVLFWLYLSFETKKVVGG